MRTWSADRQRIRPLGAPQQSPEYVEQCHDPTERAVVVDHHNELLTRRAHLGEDLLYGVHPWPRQRGSPEGSVRGIERVDRGVPNVNDTGNATIEVA